MSRQKKRRILIVLPGLKLGGAERQALLLATHLMNSPKWTVEVWGFGKADRVAELCEAAAIPWRSYPMGWPRSYIMRIKAILKFAWALRRAEPDILLPYTIRPNVICGFTWRLTGASLCIWNQRDEGRSLGVEYNWQRFAVRLVPCFLSNSTHAADYLKTTLGVDPQQIKVIPNGVEELTPQINRSIWRTQNCTPQDAFVACMVANLHHYKDHATLLQAWLLVSNHLQQCNRQAVLLLAGRHDDTYESLLTLSKELQLNDNVRFLGKVNDVASLLNAVDIGVFSSHFEGCPNGILECMSMGLAVAGTDIPGIREAVGEDGALFLSPPNDFESLANNILKLAFDQELRKIAGEKNRRRIETFFSVNRMVEESQKLIQTALPEKPLCY